VAVGLIAYGSYLLLIAWSYRRLMPLSLWPPKDGAHVR